MNAVAVEVGALRFARVDESGDLSAYALPKTAVNAVRCSSLPSMISSVSAASTVSDVIGAMSLTGCIYRRRADRITAAAMCAFGCDASESATEAVSGARISIAPSLLFVRHVLEHRERRIESRREFALPFSSQQVSRCRCDKVSKW